MNLYQPIHVDKLLKPLGLVCGRRATPEDYSENQQNMIPTDNWNDIAWRWKYWRTIKRMIKIGFISRDCVSHLATEIDPDANPSHFTVDQLMAVVEPKPEDHSDYDSSRSSFWPSGQILF
jgi:hypothetical protein